MIGNDIVDMQQAKRESNWKRKGYLNKIYSEAEQDIIFYSSNPDQMVWILWSMKEAVYKVINRETTHRFYNPEALECNIEHFGKNQIKGAVTYKGHQFKTITSCSELFVHTISTKNWKDVEVINSFSEMASYSSFPIQKDLFGVPFIYDNHNQQIPVSVSHHGNFTRVVLIK